MTNTMPAAPGAGARDPGPDDDPIEDIFADLIARLKAVAEQPDAVVTCDDLIAVIGPRSHILAILVFSLLNLLPAPPGYNFLMALIIAVLSTGMLMGREMRLWRFLGRLKLSPKLLLKLLGVLAQLVGGVAKISAPRLLAITTPAAGPAIAVIGLFLGLLMLIPIPFTNMLPSIGLAMICVGKLNRDGLLLLAGVAVGVAGLVAMIIAIWLIVLLAFVVEDVVDGDDAPL